MFGVCFFLSTPIYVMSNILDSGFNYKQSMDYRIGQEETTNLP